MISLMAPDDPMLAGLLGSEFNWWSSGSGLAVISTASELQGNAQATINIHLFYTYHKHI